ncbi:Golgi reassembly-stacking protein 2 [Babesia caballi]|uniref:Golgi reassembly-stacking protein 2 n=1 Tax=Babesia caballi TaxID=5871 RepID=A0AAV4M009_BABCB|nr:Golgi reassembly-stacking protein 2 [Babesia caballi]
MGANGSTITPSGGLRVHRVYPNGPGEKAGFEVFFDYIVEADHNGYCDDSDDTLMRFTSYVSSKENQEITLNVYNARKRSLRLVKITPRKWDGVGLLGLSVRFAEFTAMDEGAHVIKVHDGSPASRAGLMPITDYLLATNLQLFVDSDCVRVHVGEHVNEEVPLYVYNSITENIRRTVIKPLEGWGGHGTLGCDLGNGYIHRIPLVKGVYNVPMEVDKPASRVESKDEITLDLSAASATTAGEPRSDSACPSARPESCDVITLAGETNVTEDEEAPDEPYLPPSIATLKHKADAMGNDIPGTPVGYDITDRDDDGDGGYHDSDSVDY